MATLEITAACLDDEFRAMLAARGITIVDDSDHFNVKFEGPRVALIAMIAEHWPDEDYPNELVKGA